MDTHVGPLSYHKEQGQMTEGQRRKNKLRRAKRAKRVWFAKEVLRLDGGKCQAFDCDGKCGRVAAHHIILRSQGGIDEPSNGITKGYLCHEKPHGRNNPGINGKPCTGRQHMIATLDALIDSPNYRWHDAHAELKIRESLTVKQERVK